jgi:D-tyrosyl-tRNA(Tyr) deacylase
LYEYFVGRIRAAGLPCETGRFQEMMDVELVNEGPVTILLDSSKAF